MDYLKLLKDLSELNGVSGNEGKVAKYVDKILGKQKDLKRENDRLGSIIYKSGSNGPKIMLAGHMDEIGLMVTEITEDGFLKVKTVGGWWTQVMLAQEWLVETKGGKEILAITGSKPPHVLPAEKRNAVVSQKELFLDLGVTSKKEALDLGIDKGSYVTPKQDFAVLQNKKFLLGKAWDNRIGTAVLLAVADKLKEKKLKNEVFYAFTVQEEVGLRGAKTASSIIEPDIAIAIDSGIALDVPDAKQDGCKLGDGPQIIFYDGGVLPNKKLKDFIKKVAEENKVKYQEAYIEGGSTDAAAMQFSKGGAAAISLCVPARYIHSHTSVISQDDFEACVNLLVALIEKLDKKQVDEIISF